MSRGLGLMQRWILEDLVMHSDAQGMDGLLESYMYEHEEGPRRSWRPDRVHSVRNSMTRALRKLTDAGQIERNHDDKWQPVGEWTARDAIEKGRRDTAYHEAGLKRRAAALKNFTRYEF
jgi:hypothetical protein